MNNFKKLEELELAQVEFEPEQVKSNIAASMNIFRFIGDILEHFIPNIVNMFIHMTGGDADKNIRRPKYPNTAD